MSWINNGLVTSTVLASWLLVVSQATAETLIVFAPEHNSVSIRDIASGQLFKVHEVSPTALIGSGLNYRLQIRVKAGTKEHMMEIVTGQTGRFYYRTRQLSISRSKDRLQDYRLTYRLCHFLWRDILPDLDLGIGPEIQLSRINTLRHFAPNIEVDFTERYFSTAFLFVLRYEPMKNLQLDVDIANGGLFGFENTNHSSARNLAKRNTINGWLTAVDFSLTWFGSGPWGISAYLQRRETVEIGRIFQQTVAENRWGLSVGYRWERF